LLSDLRFACRQLAKAPGFTLVAVLTLALGIGANTAIFSVVNAVLLEPLPYPDSGRLMTLCESPQPGSNIPFASGGAFMDWQDRSTQFQSIAASHGDNRNLTDAGEAVRLSGYEVSSGYLGVLGIAPVMGRDFLPAEDTAAGDNNVTIVSHDLWQTHLGADPAIVGKMIHLDGVGFTVIGVLGPHALFQDDSSFLVPSHIRSTPHRQNRDYNYVVDVTGRLKPGATAARAAEELTISKEATRTLYPVFKQKWSVGVISLHERIFGNVRPYVLTLLAAVGVVLLIACANVANLLLARATVRQSEIAVRVALGATRRRIMRQMLTESLLLSVTGGIAGLFLAMASIRPLVSFAKIQEISGSSVSLSPAVLGFTLAAALATGIVFGLIPALSASSPNLNIQLKEGTRGSTVGQRRKAQALLLVSETALTVVLLVSAGLLLRSFYNAMNSNPGFNPDNVLVFDVSISDAKAPTIADKVRSQQLLVERISALPGVSSAGICADAPMNGGNGLGDLISREDRPETRNDQDAMFNSVGGDFFKALQIPTLSGRILTNQDDTEKAPKVMVINDILARNLFGKEDPVGKQLHFKGDVWEIVGVVRSVRQVQLDYDNAPEIYFGRTYFPWRSCIVVRTTVPPLTLAPEIRSAVHDFDPDLPIANLKTLRSSVDSSLQVRRVVLVLLGIFAGTATLLACVGIYGVISYSVAQRTREVGIRMALGAGRWQVVSMILAQGVRLVIIGLVIGIGASIGAGYIIAGQLYNVSRADPAVIAAVAVALMTVALIASWLPAIRAATVNPSIALRSE
jgi:predicted permease